MRLSESLCESENQQIITEMGNVLKYAQIASYFEDLQLNNLADYFKKQSLDEKSHADKFMNHLNDRTGGKVVIGEVPAPNLELNSLLDVANAYVTVEEETTESIEGLYEMALSEKSYMDLGFFSKMLDEQYLEEREATKFQKNIEMVKDIVLFDRTFGD